VYELWNLPLVVKRIKARTTSNENPEELVSFPDLLAKADLPMLTLLGRPSLAGLVHSSYFCYTYFEPNYLNFHSSLSYS
jgi:hypothetical protein